jgi:hypothetical protein
MKREIPPDYVTVMKPTDEAALAMAKAILDEERIDYIVKDDVSGMNPVIMSVEILVLREEANRAAELLRELEEGGQASPDE